MRQFDLENPDTLFISEDLEDAIIHQMNTTTFRKILYHAKCINVSDIFFQQGDVIKIKVNSLIFPISKNILQRATAATIVALLHSAREGDDSALGRIQQGTPSNNTYAYKIRSRSKGEEGVRFRVNSIKNSDRGVSVTMRLNNDEILSLEQTGMTPQDPIYLNMFPQKGLNLITGATDSGKTTLIYACLREFILHSTESAAINTYEAPIEGDLVRLAIENRVHNKVVSQTPVPGGVASFGEGVLESLRRNADIILTGEIRTPDEVDGVINGVLATGRLIMGTMHTDNIPSSINRMINTLSSNNEAEIRSKVYDLISSLNMIVSQKLLPTIDKKRVAVNEMLIFTQDIKLQLQALPVDQVSAKIKEIMIAQGKTMVDRARALFNDGIISELVFTRFEKSFSY
jgi:defect in organelle trafficking protein DotB